MWVLVPVDAASPAELHRKPARYPQKLESRISEFADRQKSPSGLQSLFVHRLYFLVCVGGAFSNSVYLAVVLEATFKKKKI